MEIALLGGFVGGWLGFAAAVLWLGLARIIGFSDPTGDQFVGCVLVGAVAIPIIICAIVIIGEAIHERR